MALQDGECSIELFKQDDACQFVRESHLAKRKREIGGAADFVAKSIRRTDGEKQRRGIAILMLPQKLRQFFRGKLFAAAVERNQKMLGLGSGALGQREQRGFIFERVPLGFSIMREAFEIFVRQRLNGGLFGFADPGNLELHIRI